MPDINPNALSLEEAPGGTGLESPPTTQPQAEPEPPADDTEPEGVVEHQGKRLVDVSIVAAERRRVREATAAAKEKEFAPVREEAQRVKQLEAALAEVRPIIEQVRQYGLPKAPPPEPAEAAIPDERAERYARRFELYDRGGQPDIARAKAILAEQHEEVATAARAAVESAVGPIKSYTAEEASRRNLERVASARDNAGQPVLHRAADPRILAQLWAQLPPELTAHEEVGDLVLNAAIGATMRQRGMANRPEREPLISEPSGGRSGGTWQMDAVAKSIAAAAGMSEKAFTEQAKDFKPGAVNVIGD